MVIRFLVGFIRFEFVFVFVFVLRVFLFIVLCLVFVFIFVVLFVIGFSLVSMLLVLGRIVGWFEVKEEGVVGLFIFELERSVDLLLIIGFNVVVFGILCGWVRVLLMWFKVEGFLVIGLIFVWFDVLEVWIVFVLEIFEVVGWGIGRGIVVMLLCKSDWLFCI